VDSWHFVFLNFAKKYLYIYKPKRVITVVTLVIINHMQLGHV